MGLPTTKYNVGICQNPDTEEAFVSVRPPLSAMQLGLLFKKRGMALFLFEMDKPPRAYMDMVVSDKTATYISSGNKTYPNADGEDVIPTDRARQRAMHFTAWLSLGEGGAVTIDPRVEETTVSASSLHAEGGVAPSPDATVLYK